MHNLLQHVFCLTFTLKPVLFSVLSVIFDMNNETQRKIDVNQGILYTGGRGWYRM
jgi:hypothetical protein